MKFDCAHDELIDVSKLLMLQNPKNNNKHSKEQIERLAKIIDFQGQRSPIVISKRSGFITKGHGRLFAIDKLGWEKAAVNYQDYLSEAQEYADMTADNEIARWAEFDEEKFLEDIKTVDLGDFELLGLQELPDILEPEKECLTDPDDVPEVAQNIHNVELGQIWKLGNHRLMCGDSTDKETVEKLMNGEKAQTFFTDPPYGDNVGGLVTKKESERSNKDGERRLVKRAEFIHNDKEIDWLESVFKIVPQFLEIESTKMVFFKWDKYEQIKKIASIFGEPSALCVWDRVRKTSAFFRFQPQHELCFHWGNQSDKKETSSLSNVWRVPKELENKELHPTVKPIDMIDPIIRVTTDSNKAVLDLFGGSGSTLIACEKTNRKCFMMELDPHYCSVIIERWQQFTGQKAELING